MNGLNYYLLHRNNLMDLAKFVVQENYNHHFTGRQTTQDEIEMVYHEELKLNNSKIFASIDNDYSIVGSIRVLKWNQMDILPIRSKKGDIWHIGRFAIKKGIDKAGFNVFKTLMVCAINEVCKSENSIALAECDAKLLKILRLLEIEAIILADSIDYLGSETIPVLLTYEGLNKFLSLNRDLLPQNYSSFSGHTFLHKNVVFQVTL